MKKTLLLAGLVLMLIGFGVWWQSNSTKTNSDVSANQEELLFNVYRISKQYGALRYRTDKLLTNPQSYANPGVWREAVGVVIQDWSVLVTDAESLETKADEISREPLSWNWISAAQAYDKQEISQVFDSAPAGRKIATLAKHLGVDAKMAMKILEQDQAQVTADAWNEAGDQLQTLETSATVIKDGAKVTVFVGTIVATGGAAGFAAGSTISQGSVIVSGADLILEVTDDAAKIGLGNHNKISSIVGQVRQVTEPLAGLLAVADIPSNVTKGIEKLSAVTFGAEQLNSTIQEGKIIGIELPAAKKTEKFQNIKKYQAPVYISKIDNTEVDTWIKDKVAQVESDNEQSAQELFGLDQVMVKSDEAQTETASSSSTEATSDQLESNQDVDQLKSNQDEKQVESNQDGGNIETTESVRLKLDPIKQTIGNDWQGALRISLFNNAPIVIDNGVFEISYRDNYNFGSFEGFGEIKLRGSYNSKTGVIKGTHYRKYEGVYKNEPIKIAYSGSFEATIPVNTNELKINFNGSIETTRVDGKGKSYTTTSQGGVSYKYNIIKNK